MKKIIKAVNFNSIDMFNAAASKPLNKAEETIPMVGAAIIEDTDEDTGETKRVGCVKDSDGVIYGTISGTVISQLESMEALFEDEEVVMIKVQHGTANSGRDYITIRVISG